MQEARWGWGPVKSSMAKVWTSRSNEQVLCTCAIHAVFMVPCSDKPERAVSGIRSSNFLLQWPFCEKWEAPASKLVGQEHFLTCPKWCIHPKPCGFLSCPVMNKNGLRHCTQSNCTEILPMHCCLTWSLFARPIPWLDFFTDLTVKPLIHQVPFHLFNFPVLSGSKQILKTRRY